MKMLRVLPPLVASAVVIGSASAPAWAADPAAVPAAGAAVSTAPLADTASIPAFDIRFPVTGPVARTIARPGLLTLRASVGLRCAFNGAWTDYSAAAFAKRPATPFNAVASIGCAPVANATGAGNVEVRLGAKLVGSRNLSWRLVTGPRPSLPVVKLPTTLSPAALAALQARIARTPGGVPASATPAGRADCRIISAWRGFPTDAFPRTPRTAYRSAALGWVAVACKPVSNAAGSVTVKAPVGAARGLSWGSFTPYTLPPAAPIPAFDLAYPNAPKDSVSKLSLAVTPLGGTAPGAMVCSITSTTSTIADPTTLRAGIACLPSSWHGGSIKVTLRYGGTPVASVDKAWADVNSPRRPRLPAIKIPLVGWPDISALTAAAPRSATANSAAVAAVAGATPTQIADAKAYMARAAKVLESIRVRADLARSQKDIIMLNCVNDKLTQASGNNQILIQRVTALHELLDEAKLAHEWTVAGIVDQKLQVLNLEANACVGVLESNIDSGGGRAEVTVDATLPNHHEVPPSVSPVIVVPPYVGKPASTGPDNLGSPSWWRPTVPAAWAAPAADPIRWTPRSVVPVRVNCPALDSQGCADELIRIQAAAQAIKNGGGPDLQVQPEPSSSKFAPHNPAAGQGHGDPAFPGGLSVTFTKPGAIKKNPDGSWVRVDGRVQLLPGELAKGYTDIFYDRTVLANGGKPNEAGVGGFDWANKGQGAKITDGYVAIDASTLAGVPAWKIQALYMHELGHAIGLTHPDQTRTLPDGSSQAGLPSVGQIMDSTIDVPDARWGNGDLAGLAAVGGAATK